ncbi:MAG: multicopper oxidase family protein [Gemmatimonadota bacterium]
MKRSIVLALLSLAFAAAAPGQPSPRSSPVSDRCPMDPPLGLPYCAAVVATPDLPGVRGVLELRPLRSPFGIAVTADGRARHLLEIRLRDLPAPDSLGSYRRWVAWIYDLSMGAERRLGVVGNGVNRLGEVDREHFRIVISAERDAAPGGGGRRRGRTVARVTSPAAALLAHRDAMALQMAMASSAAAGHAAHGGWSPPPLDPRIAQTMGHISPSTPAWLPPDTEGIPPARPREVITLSDGDTVRLDAVKVKRTIGGKPFVMYGYNGQYPGPLIRVRQSSEVIVRFRNLIDLPSTIHWHGLRLENRFDGVPHLTQDPVAPGDSFTYRLRFPDAGVYWYHPHVREDIQQELGLYGNILVAARRARARVPVNREEVLALDDILLGDDGRVFPFGSDTSSHALMGRFGNTMLVNGEPDYRLQVKRGEVVRFHLTNVANARVFNLRIPGARLKLIGSDLGNFEREEWVESVVIAPAERYVVEARFDRSGTFPIVNAVRWLDHMRGTTTAVQDTIGLVTAGPERASPDHAAAFAVLRTAVDDASEIRRFRRLANRPVDHTLVLSVDLDGLTPDALMMISGGIVPIDWNDAMPSMNWAITAREARWRLRDENGRVNMDIRWEFRAGDVRRITLVNDATSVHPMAHPIHIHGQRFLVLSRNGVPNSNMAWKDTAVVPAGESMDILLELSNPGEWMLHCHVAEHLGSGMMSHFRVLP